MSGCHNTIAYPLAFFTPSLSDSQPLAFSTRPCSLPKARMKGWKYEAPRMAHDLLSALHHCYKVSARITVAHHGW